MERTVSVRELHAKTSEILRRVAEEREPVIVTLRGREIARIHPARRATREALEEWSRKADALAEEIGKVWPEGVSAVQALSEDRSRFDGP